MSSTEVITAVTSTITTLGLWGFIFAGLIVGLSLWFFKKARR
jgi:hypothetical protein